MTEVYDVWTNEGICGSIIFQNELEVNFKYDYVKEKTNKVLYCYVYLNLYFLSLTQSTSSIAVQIFD